MSNAVLALLERKGKTLYLQELGKTKSYPRSALYFHQEMTPDVPAMLLTSRTESATA